jgi:hypothetical protein
MDDMIWEKESVAGEWLLQSDKACRQISEDGGCAANCVKKEAWLGVE